MRIPQDCLLYHREIGSGGAIQTSAVHDGSGWWRSQDTCTEPPPRLLSTSQRDASHSLGLRWGADRNSFGFGVALRSRWRACSRLKSDRSLGGLLRDLAASTVQKERSRWNCTESPSRLDTARHRRNACARRDYCTTPGTTLAWSRRAIVRIMASLVLRSLGTPGNNVCVLIGA